MHPFFFFPFFQLQTKLETRPPDLSPASPVSKPRATLFPGSFGGLLACVVQPCLPARCPSNTVSERAWTCVQWVDVPSEPLRGFASHRCRLSALRTVVYHAVCQALLFEVWSWERNRLHLGAAFFFFFFRNTGPQASPDLLNQSLHFNKSSGDFCACLRVTALGWAFYEDGGERT